MKGPLGGAEGRHGRLRCLGFGKGRLRRVDGGHGMLVCAFVGFGGVGLLVVEELRVELAGLGGSLCRSPRPRGRHYC